jgi:hypothetical protein
MESAIVYIIVSQSNLQAWVLVVDIIEVLMVLIVLNGCFQSLFNTCFLVEIVLSRSKRCANISQNCDHNLSRAYLIVQ